MVNKFFEIYHKYRRKKFATISIEEEFNKFVKENNLPFSYSEKSGASIWMNKKENYLIKTFGSVAYEGFPVRAIPTIILQNKHDDLFCQRIANVSVSAVEKSYKILRGIYHRKNKNETYRAAIAEVGEDLHEGNVGLYKNKAVVFDW